MIGARVALVAGEIPRPFHKQARPWPNGDFMSLRSSCASGAFNAAYAASLGPLGRKQGVFAAASKIPCGVQVVEILGPDAAPIWRAFHGRASARPLSDDFAAQDNPAASSFWGEVCRDGRARIVCDGALYFVQRQRRSGWWRVVASAPDVRTLRLAVLPSSARPPVDGGPCVRSDLLTAALDALPFAASDWSGQILGGLQVEPVASVLPVDRGEPVALRRGRPVGAKDRRKRKPATRGPARALSGQPRKRRLVPGKLRGSSGAG